MEWEEIEVVYELVILLVLMFYVFRNVKMVLMVRM